MPLRRAPLPKLPPLAEQKLTKTTYTRGAALGEMYQNRVTRSNTVLIPWTQWDACKQPDDGTDRYENGFIVLVEPSWYFETGDADHQLAAKGLKLSKNALLTFRRRADWVAYGPDTRSTLPNGLPYSVATSRTTPLGGVYFGRVAATVAAKGTQVNHGFNTSELRGAGIRVFEYASTDTIRRTKLQLEALMWLCQDAYRVVQQAGMSKSGATDRSSAILKSAQDEGLLDWSRLQKLRMVNDDNETICPLCLNPLSTGDFLKRSEQAEGREVHDLTTTEVSLFHIQELRVGKLQHKVYNLGWGHHHCNVVVKDSGIMPTLQWMKAVLDNQPVMDLETERQSVEEAIDG